jgi:hypothetical protein
MASEITANKISPATGTAFTIGDSGDTFTVPSGATLAVASGATISNAGTQSGFGKVLQVVQTLKTDGFSTNSTSHIDITGLSASITPSSTSSKILVNVSIGTIDFSVAMAYGFQLVRDSTDIGQGTVAGKTASTFGGTGNQSRPRAQSYLFLDSPSTTSATTYKVQVRGVGGTCYINYRHDSNNLTTSSTITLMEIAG